MEGEAGRDLRPRRGFLPRVEHEAMHDAARRRRADEDDAPVIQRAGTGHAKHRHRQRRGVSLPVREVQQFETFDGRPHARQVREPRGAARRRRELIARRGRKGRRRIRFRR